MSTKRASEMMGLSDEELGKWVGELYLGCRDYATVGALFRALFDGDRPSRCAKCKCSLGEEVGAVCVDCMEDPARDELVDVRADITRTAAVVQALNMCPGHTNAIANARDAESNAAEKRLLNLLAQERAILEKRGLSDADILLAAIRAALVRQDDSRPFREVVEAILSGKAPA